MRIITQLVILTLSLLLVNAYDVDDEYCSNLIKDFKNNCTTSMVIIGNCCDVKTLQAPGLYSDLKTSLASGVYKISKGTFDSYANAYCDMLTDHGGWMVIQRNKKDSSVNFNRNWTDYEKGFGDLRTEFWYGLEEIHCLTQRGQWEMRLDYKKTDNTWSYLYYSNFSIGSANEEYPLTIGGFTGEGTDYFTSHPLNGLKFSTSDNDNDRHSSTNCAQGYKHGWWHNRCTHIHINYQPPYIYNFNVLTTEIKIRPKDCIIQ